MRWQIAGGLALLIAGGPCLGAPGAPIPQLIPRSFATSAPNMLGTVALPIRADRFADSLKRAREDDTHLPALQRLIAPARSLSPIQQMAFVQRSVQNAVHWISDATEYGQHDYWASAAQTLSVGAGDMEDRAIVKMQALRALGFSNSNLFLTLARDRVGGPITVLTARVGGRYYVLDDTGGAPFPVDERRNEFQPEISFGMYGAWIHSHPTAVAAAALPASSYSGK